MIRLVLHHVRKDLRAVRPWLALWLALLTVNTAALVPAVDLALLGAKGFTSWVNLVSAARLVLGMLVAARVVGADSPAGTTGFWLTRPVPSRAVFLAKLTVLSGLVGVAAAANVVGLLLNSLDPAAVPAALAEIVVFEALPLLPLAVVASLTSDTARLVLGGLGCLLLYSASRAIAVAVTGFGGNRAGIALLLVGPIAVGWSTWCLGLQYVARRARRTLGLAGVGLGLVAAIGFVAASAATPTDVTADWPAGKSVSASVAVVTMPGARRVYGALDLQGVPPGIVVRAHSVDATLRFQDGHVEHFREKFGSRSAYTITGQSALDPRVAAAAGHALEAAVFRVQDDANWFARIPLMIAGGQALEARPGMPGRYEATLKLVACRLRLGARIPPRLSERVGVASRDVAIVARRQSENAFSLDVRLTRPGLLWHASGELEFLLVNRARGEAMPGHLASRPVRSESLAPFYLLSPIATLNFSRRAGGRRWLDDEWLEGAELAILAIEEEGSFTKRVTMDEVTVR